METSKKVNVLFNSTKTPETKVASLKILAIVNQDRLFETSTKDSNKAFIVKVYEVVTKTEVKE